MEKSPKIAKIFECKCCNYMCSKNSDYTKHISTPKHKNNIILNNLEQKVAKNRKTFVCKNCNKKYKARNSLWYHEKVCKQIDENSEINLNKETDKDVIMLLIKENSDLKNMMIKVLENGTHNTTHTNSHNKAFNLNFFLNETCKDAMNIMDFVDSIKLQLCDLERVGELGFVDGISNIIIKNLKNS